MAHAQAKPQRHRKTCEGTGELPEEIKQAS